MTKNKNKKDVESYIEELEQITEQLDKNDIKLSEAVELYRKGSIAATKAETLLNQFEKEIEIIDQSEIGEET